MMTVRATLRKAGAMTVSLGIGYPDDCSEQWLRVRSDVAGGVHQS